MNDLNWLAVGVSLGLFALGGSIVFLATRVSKALSITVQAPTALVPEHVTDLLRRIEERLQPVKPPMSDEAISKLVAEGVRLAEASTLKGADKFRIAREYVMQRAEVAATTVNERDIALRIEAVVAGL